MPVGQAVTATSAAAGRRGGGGAADAAGAGAAAGAAAAAAGAAAGAATTPLDQRRRPPRASSAAAQAVGEVLLHQRAGQLGQQLEVGGVAAGRGGDQEGQVGRAVLGAEVDRRGRAARRPAWATSTRVGAAVRDRDAAGQPGGGGRLAGEGVRGELVGVVGAAGVGDRRGERPDDVGLSVPEVERRGDEPE